jgi:DNA-binding ferritin-like protein
MEEKCVPKNACFYCSFCDFTCFKNSNYIIHKNTKKHKHNANGNILETMEIKKNANYSCNCGKQFKTNAGLWKHKKKCITLEQSEIHKTINENKVTIEDKDQIIMMLIKQNTKLMEIIENGTTNMNNSHNTTTNSHNKAFNLNFFLNETCKNAMNITDFVESIKLQLSDFISMGDIGFVEGISNIIVKNLNSLDETVRPIHCTDQKRETFYVKDANIWEKEEDDKKKLHKMVKSVVYKNEKLMKTYKETYPDYNNPESKRSDQYSKIMIEAMDCKVDSREKIIKNISKVITIKSK